MSETPYGTAGKIMVLYIFVCTFVDRGHAVA
jgi:hypothetical protein